MPKNAESKEPISVSADVMRLLFKEEFDKGFSVIKKYVDSRFDKVEQRLDKVEQKLDNVEQRLDKVEKKLVEIEQRLKAVEDKLEALHEYVNVHFDMIDERFNELGLKRWASVFEERNMQED